MGNGLFASFPHICARDVILRRIRDDDIDRLYEIYSNDNLFRYTPGSPRRNKVAVAHMIGHFQRDFDKGKMVYLGIALPETDELVGIVELFDYDRRVGAVTLGYRLHEGFWGRGIATSAVRAAARYLFEEVGINRIQAFVMPENERSQAVLRRCGFAKEGVIRQGYVWKDIGVVDLVLYSRLRGDAAE